VLQRLGENGILASICAPNTTDTTRDDFGYRHAMDSLIARVRPHLPAQ
jgi:hypothetical protein